MKEKENMEKVEMKKPTLEEIVKKIYDFAHDHSKTGTEKRVEKIANLLAKQLNKYNDFGAAQELLAITATFLYNTINASLGIIGGEYVIYDKRIEEMINEFLDIFKGEGELV